MQFPDIYGTIIHIFLQIWFWIEKETGLDHYVNLLSFPRASIIFSSQLMNWIMFKK